MQIVGQPARDLCRHFVQRYDSVCFRHTHGLNAISYRWNYLLRVKNHSRKMPFLLPPPDFKPAELTEQGLTGTCELQICRSAGAWSLGTQNRIEHSIQNAYLKGNFIRFVEVWTLLSSRQLFSFPNTLCISKISSSLRRKFGVDITCVDG
jgi:hypothetical protein